jgi:hypothetical protein
VAGVGAALAWALVGRSWASAGQFVTLIGPAVLLLPIWLVGALPGLRRPGAIVLLGWVWVCAASYVYRYRPTWPMSEFDQVPLDLLIFLVVIALVGLQMAGTDAHRSGAPPPTPPEGHPFPRGAVLGIIVVVGAIWWCAALVTSMFTETPPDGVATVLELPAGTLRVRASSDRSDWSCSTVGEFCGAAVVVTASDGADPATVVDRVDRHLQSLGWHDAASQTIDKGLIVKVPLTVGSGIGPDGAAWATVEWGTNPMP